MNKQAQIAVIIPALNEADNIGELVCETLREGARYQHLKVIVVDNGSTDETGKRACDSGAQVVVEPRRGYGSACAAGVRVAAGAELLVFMDGDYSSLPSEIHRLIEPILQNKADLVLGSRVLGNIAQGAMPPHQRFGNWLTSGLMRLIYRVNVTDLGPYRATRRDLLQQLQMQEMTFGWPTEMMVKAARQQAKLVEVPVSWHQRRHGHSKVSGTIRGSILAATYILGVTFRYAW